METHQTKLIQIIKILTDIGKSLSAEKDHVRLLELILLKAMEITNADGGTIYTCTDQNSLQFEISYNHSLNIHVGGTSKIHKHFADLPLYDAEGNPNKNMLAPWAVITHKTINIKDAYAVARSKFDLSGTRHFDKSKNYRTQSILTVPMANHQNEVIGVLQLINTMSAKKQTPIHFSKIKQYLAESLASQAAIILSNRDLINAQKALFDALIQLIAKAIDEKSPYTGDHCRRVPVLSLMLAKAACATKKGPLKDFTMTEDEMYELEVAAWLHDCGKITTPEAVVDKATKLHRIIDGIELVDTRFEILKRDLTIETLQNKIKALTGSHFATDKDVNLQKQLAQLDHERNTIRDYNIGREHFLPSQLETIKKISKRQWKNTKGEMENFLTDEEVQLLEISRGTLSTPERKIINNHVTMTLNLLKTLPYPKNLRNVPELAGSHHEKMDGSGYPRGLVKEQMSIPARMIAIADIFEALTAGSRPYKKAMSLTQALTILGQMKVDGHIDPDLFDVFMDKKLYLTYAKEYLDKAQYESLDLSNIPGYSAR